MSRGTGRRLEYDFLGAAPPSRWWSVLSDRGLVVLEEPGIIAYADGTALSILLSGIPSAHRDMIGTEIRYTVVVDDLQDDVRLARNLAAAGLSSEQRALLGRELDRAFDVAKVNAVLGGSSDGADTGPILSTILRSPGWSADRPEEEAGTDDIMDSWAAPADDPGARAAFLARIGSLPAGQGGFAFTTSCLSTQKGAGDAVARLPGTHAILLADGDLGKLVPLAKKVPEAPRPVNGRLLTSTRTRTLTATGAGVIILLMLLVSLLVFR